MSRDTPRWSESDLEAAKQRMLGRGGVVGHARKSLTAPVLRHGPYKNKLEYTYAQVCEMEKRAGEIKDWTYESMTLKLSVAMPGKRGDYHRTDFLKWHNDGSIEIAQTKGWHKNILASLKGLRWAAQKNPWFRFTIKRYKNGWTSEEIA